MCSRTCCGVGVDGSRRTGGLSCDGHVPPPSSVSSGRTPGDPARGGRDGAALTAPEAGPRSRMKRSPAWRGNAVSEQDRRLWRLPGWRRRARAQHGGAWTFWRACHLRLRGELEQPHQAVGTHLKPTGRGPSHLFRRLQSDPDTGSANSRH